jgi:hypothetical protein
MKISDLNETHQAMVRRMKSDGFQPPEDSDSLALVSMKLWEYIQHLQLATIHQQSYRRHDYVLHDNTYH